MSKAGAPKRKAAKRPGPRTVVVRLDGEFDGWEVTARVDLPMRFFLDLQKSSSDQALAMLEQIIVDHNLPNSDDEIAASLADVDPFYGLQAVSDAIGKAIGKLPPR